VNGSEMQKVLFLAPSVCGFLFVYEIAWKLLNRFVPNSHRRCVWYRHKGQKMAFLPLSAACMRFMFGKTSLASSYFLFIN